MANILTVGYVDDEEEKGNVCMPYATINDQ